MERLQSELGCRPSGAQLQSCNPVELGPRAPPLSSNVLICKMGINKARPHPGEQSNGD